VKAAVAVAVFKQQEHGTSASSHASRSSRDVRDLGSAGVWCLPAPSSSAIRSIQRD
jgi:hypothetical protein